MSFLLKVISFPSQAEQSSGPRGLGNLFHKTDSLASIQSLGTTQPRRTNKSFSDAAPDTLRCMFHSFIPAFILFASCSNKKRGAESTSKPTRKQNQSITLSFGSWKKKWVHRVSCVSVLAFLSRRPVRSGNFRPFCGPVPSASGHVSLQDLTEALMRQIRPAWWLPLVEVAPRAGYWLMAWASFWAAETSLPQTLHQQGPSSGTSCLTGLTGICQRKETITKFLPCSLKKITRHFFSFFGSHTQSPDWKSPVGDKTHLCCGKIVVTIGEGWWKGTGALTDWCDPYFHQHTGGVGVLLVKILQAVHTGTFLYVC